MASTWHFLCCMDMVSYVVSEFAINISMFHTRHAHAYSTAHAGHLAVPTNWPANNTVDMGRAREIRQPIRATSRDRQSCETSEMEARLMSRAARV